MIGRMKHQRIVVALVVVACAWFFALGTVAVVEFARLVDVLEVAGAPVSGRVAAFEALPVEWGYNSDTELSGIADALKGIYVPGYLDLHLTGLSEVASALESIASAIRRHG